MTPVSHPAATIVEPDGAPIDPRSTPCTPRTSSPVTCRRGPERYPRRRRDKVLGRAKYTADDPVPATRCGSRSCTRPSLTATSPRSTPRTPRRSRVWSRSSPASTSRCPFPTAGHPWSTDPSATRTSPTACCWNRHVRYWGDEIAVVVAETRSDGGEGRRRRATATYEELPFALNPLDSNGRGHGHDPGGGLPRAASWPCAADYRGHGYARRPSRSRA